jgi:very-short-patch-repair endonuclease
MLPPHSNQRSAYLHVRKIARALRKNQTRAEIFFWSQVRDRRLFGLKFTRQHIIQCPFDPTFTKFFIADFYCHQLYLIIELDGDIHEKQQEQDLVRSELMENNGYRVLRFRNAEGLEDWPHVISRIASFLK